MREGDPIDRLESTHRKLEERLEDLATAVGAVARPADRDDGLALARDVLHYLRRAMARHEDDEEGSLFPRLAGDDALAPVLERLAAEHVEQRRLVAALDDAIARAEAGDRGDNLASVARALATSYREHVRVEDELLLPRARELLDAPTREIIAAEMEARRGGGQGGGGGGRGRGDRR